MAATLLRRGPETTVARQDEASVRSGAMASPPSRTQPLPPPTANRSDRPDDLEQSMEGAQTKRRKVAVACEACRERKVRCDGAHPSKDAAALQPILRWRSMRWQTWLTTTVCGTCAKRRSTTKCVYSTIRDETQLASKE